MQKYFLALFIFQSTIALGDFISDCTKPKRSQKKIINTLKSLYKTKNCHTLQLKLSKTKKLWLNKKNLIDISPLANLKHLEQLDLSDNHIKDISSLKSLTNLKKLWLGENFISSIEVLSFLPQLQLLELEDNHISSLSPLKHNQSLTALDFSRNKIKSLEPLSELENLMVLIGEKNQITDISPLTEYSPTNLNKKIKSIRKHQTFLPEKFMIVNLSDNPITQPLWLGGVKKTDQNCPPSPYKSLRKICRY